VDPGIHPDAGPGGRGPSVQGLDVQGPGVQGPGVQGVRWVTGSITPGVEHGEVATIVLARASDRLPV